MRLRVRCALAALAVVAVPAVASGQAPLEPLGQQVRLTAQGVDGDPTIDATSPSVAYNVREDEYLLAWSGQGTDSPRDEEIFVRRLNSDGLPTGGAERRTSVGPASDPAIHARDPVLVYDGVHNRYAVAYVSNAEAPAPTAGNQSDVFIRLLDSRGMPLGEPRRVSSAAPGRALEPDIVHHAADDRFMVVWREDPGASPDAAHVLGRLVSADTGEPQGERPEQISATQPQLPGASEPTLALRPGDAAFAVTWVGNVADPTLQATSPYKREILARLVLRDGTPSPEEPRQVTQTGPVGARDAVPAAPDLAVNFDRTELMLVFAAVDDPESGEEVYIQRLSPDLAPLGPPREISAAGPFGSREGYRAHHPRVSYHRSSRSFLVTWRGTDEGRSGLSDAEFELMGQVVEGTGVQVGRDDFVVSRMGLDGAGNSAPAADVGSVAVNERTGRWLVVWAGDDARPPTADEELEIWGRHVGPNLDRDYDGSPTPADCDDLDPRRRPGIRDVPDNGIDEDCTGKDNLDSDGDGSPRPKDCNDRNPFINPKRRDIPGNGIDEDCSGRDSLLPTQAKVRVTWVFGATSVATRLQVERVRRGMKVRLLCRGGGCPAGLRRGRALRVRRHGTLRLTHHLRGVPLHPGAAVEVRVLDPKAIGLLERYRMRRGQPPSRRTLCLHPPRARPRRCRT